MFTKSMTWSQRKADGVIALISMAWGTSYLFMKVGLGGVTPFALTALRFGIAFLVTSCLFCREMRRINPRTVGYGAIMGLVLFGVFGFLLYGMESTTASTAGFLTSTTVVFVPIFLLIVTRKKPQWKIIAGTLLSIAGIALLTIQDSLKFNRESMLCIFGALMNAWYIILVDRFARKTEGLLLGICQLGFTSLYGLIACVIFERPTLPANAAQWGAVVALALLCSALGFVLQPVAQKHTSPEHTGILFALEPCSPRCSLPFFCMKF